jgi:hypothetical protein
MMCPSFHGFVSVEGDTWEEAVASLTLDDWERMLRSGATVAGNSNSAWSMSRTRTATSWPRTSHFNCAMVNYFPVVHRLTHILDTCDLSDDAAAALVAFIDELRTMGQDPIFNKEYSK